MIGIVTVVIGVVFRIVSVGIVSVFEEKPGCVLCVWEDVAWFNLCWVEG